MKVYSIGRNEDCTIVLDNPMVSRRHALLKVHATGKMELVSLGTNGTFVNGNKLKPNAPYTVKRSDVVSFAHAKQLDWDLVENPIWWLKYALYGLVAIIVVGLAYAMIDHWLIKKPKQPEPTEQLAAPKTSKSQSKTDKGSGSVTDNNGKSQGSNNKMEGAKPDKAKSDAGEDKGGSFFPKQKKTVNGAPKVEKQAPKGSKASTDKDKEQQKQKQEKKSDKSSTDESGFNVI